MVYQKISKSASSNTKSAEKSASIAPQSVPFSLTPIAHFHEFTQVPVYSPTIQAKLTIGLPNDRYEQEADRVAAQVVQQLQRPASIQRQDELNETIQAKSMLQRPDAIVTGEASTQLASEIDRHRGGGQSLDVGLQKSMGQAMGADFRRVRVHTDGQSDQLNRSIQAEAFTTGQDVFFRNGGYQPSSRGGQELIAHELTHVMQQNVGDISRSNASPSLSNLVQCQFSGDLINKDGNKDGQNILDSLKAQYEGNIPSLTQINRLVFDATIYKNLEALAQKFKLTPKVLAPKVEIPAISTSESMTKPVVEKPLINSNVEVVPKVTEPSLPSSKSITKPMVTTPLKSSKAPPKLGASVALDKQSTVETTIEKKGTLINGLRTQWDKDKAKFITTLRRVVGIGKELTDEAITDLINAIDGNKSLRPVSYMEELKNPIDTLLNEKVNQEEEKKKKAIEARQIRDRIGPLFRNDDRDPSTIAAATEFNRRGMQSLPTARALAVRWFCGEDGADSLMTTWVNGFPATWPITSTGPASEGVGVVKGWSYGLEHPSGLTLVPKKDLAGALGQAVHSKNADCKLTLYLNATTVQSATMIAVAQGHGNNELAFFTPIPAAHIKSYVKYGLPGIWKHYPGDFGDASKREAEELLQTKT